MVLLEARGTARMNCPVFPPASRGVPSLRVAEYDTMRAMKVLLLLILIAGIGCGGVRVKHPPLMPSQVKWKTGKCTQARVAEAHQLLLAGDGAPWAAMYFMRCRNPSDRQKASSGTPKGDKALAAIKGRRIK